MNMPLRTKQSKAMPFVGVFLAALFWGLDAALDVYLFGESKSYFDSLYSPEPVELWMRSVVTMLLIGFGLYSSRVLSAQNEAAKLIDAKSRQLVTINLTLEEEIKERQKIEDNLRRIAAYDSLTSLLNRRKFDEILESEIQKERRQSSGLTLVFCDIDHFKNVNDQYGHSVGDNVLKQFAKRLQDSVRETDIVARWGGEEFVILLPNTEEEASERLANKIQTEMESFEFDLVGKITTSIGVTHLKDEDSREAMLKRVDKALYAAKGKGRNRVEIAS